MSSIASLVAANVDALSQGIRLLRAVDDELYVRRNDLVFDSTIGGHVRHVVDHVECCLVGLAQGRFDYEHRRRDPAVECSRVTGMRALGEAAARLSDLDVAGSTAHALVRSGDAAGRWVPTSCERELEFLHSHTVHHYALIAVLCRLEGVEPDSAFGVAPSTLRYRGVLPRAPA